MTNTSERDELAAIIWDKTDCRDEDSPDAAADAILAAGYSKEPESKLLADSFDAGVQWERLYSGPIKNPHRMPSRDRLTSAAEGCCEDHSPAESVNEWSLRHAADGLAGLGASATLTDAEHQVVNFAYGHLLRAAEFVREARK